MNQRTATATDLVATLGDRRDQVLKVWTDRVASTLGGRTTRAELEPELSDLLDALLSALATKSFNADSVEFEPVTGLLAELSASRAQQGFTPSETAGSIFSLKEAALEVATGGTPSAADIEQFMTFSRLVDELGLVTFESYVVARESVIAAQAEQVLELSTPVVKIWDGVLAVPIVGTLDSVRAQVIMENLLEMLVDTGSTHAIIDITGVPAVDTQVAQHLLKTIAAARLMGAECIVSGVRPQTAQTIVTLGIEFGDIVTRASLADALALALERSGTTVRHDGS